MVLFDMIDLLDIQNDLVTKDTDLTCILRKCLVLAFDLDSDELKNWVKMELNGYDKWESCPDYRKINTHFEGEFIKYECEIHEVNSIYSSIIPADYIKIDTTFPLSFGVSYILSLYDRHQPYPEEYIRDFTVDSTRSQYNGYIPGYRCIRFVRVIPTEALAYVLDLIRNRMLDFILELRDIYPDKYIDNKKIDNSIVKNIFNTTIHGNANISNASGEFGQKINEK